MSQAYRFGEIRQDEGATRAPPLSIRVGTVRQRNELVPKKQVWFRSAQHWLADLGGVAKRDKA